MNEAVTSQNRSESIAAIAGALSSAQGEIEGAAKDRVNPHFKSSYADLASVWAACRAALAKHGIAVVQSPESAGDAQVSVRTLLAHKSGEWIESVLTMTATQNTPQGVGSCITYARRYALAAMVGVAPEDDDGNAASEKSPQSGRREEPTIQQRPRPTDTRASEAEFAALQSKREEMGVSKEDVTAYVTDSFKTTPQRMTSEQVCNVVAWLNLGAPAERIPAA